MNEENWSINSVTLFNLIKSMNQPAIDLFSVYQDYEDIENRYFALQAGQDEDASLLKYYESQLQDTSTLRCECIKKENELDQLLIILERMEKNIEVLEKSVTANELTAVRFLDKYRVGYQQTEELLKLCNRDVSPEDFVSGFSSIIYDFCRLIWYEGPFS